jgi:hypothetical protein
VDAVDAPPHAARASIMTRRFRSRPATAVAITTLLLLVSLPARINGRLATLDWTRISYGFYDVEKGPAGESFRWSGPRARFFVNPETTRIAIPLRANAVSAENPLQVEIFLDGRLQRQVQLSTRNWQTVELSVTDRSTTSRSVDIVPSRSWIPAQVFKGSTDRRRLGVQVGEVKSE